MKYISVHKLILTILSLFILTGCQNSPQTRDDEEDTLGNYQLLLQPLT